MVEGHFFESNRKLYFNEVESTNIVAMQKIKDHQAQHGDIIIANFQSQGKGQQGNKWFSSAGSNILCSFICKDMQISANKLASLNMIISLAVHKVINNYFGGRCFVKWPNDIFVEDKKIAGILVESVLSGTTIKHLIIGIGINVNESSFPAELAPACSFYTFTNQKIATEDILNQLILSLNNSLSQLPKLSIQDIIKSYQSVQYAINQKMYFRVGNSKIEGVILGINPEGQLRLQTQSGILTFNTKEISLDDTSN